MARNNRSANRLRPPPVKIGDAPEVDLSTGEHIFRFSATPPNDVAPEDLFRWVVEEQLRALLEVVELADDTGARVISQYRFHSDVEFRQLYASEED